MRGFTLIEALVVLALAGLMLALVAPLGVSQVERARAQAEWLALERLTGRLAFEAFTRHESVMVSAAGEVLQWRWQGIVDASGHMEPDGERLFEHLTFAPATQVRINANGLPSPARVQVVVRGERRELVLDAWVPR